MSRLTPREILLESLGDEVVAVLKEQGFIKPDALIDDLDRIMGEVANCIAESDISRIADIADQWHIEHVNDYSEFNAAPEYVQGVSAGLQMARRCLEAE